jgi:hypothetical protein
MKTVHKIPLLILVVVALAGFVHSQVLAMSRNPIEPNQLLESPFEVTRWTSDAGGLAYVLDNPDDETPITVSQGYGKKHSEGLGKPGDYVRKFSEKPDIQELRDKETGNLFGYVLVEPRLIIESRYQGFRKRILVRVRDPKDAYHRKQFEGKR